MAADWPDPFVQRVPFNECSPLTPEGIRRLALIIAQECAMDALFYLDGLELHMLKVLKIKPQGDFSRDDKVVPIDIGHRPRRGLTVRWEITKYIECEVCDGFGTLKALGKDGKYYRVDCPECLNGGSIEDEVEYVTTDIDGELLAA
jgi:hypothetical protein